MCGICGLLYFDAGRQASEAELRPMVETLRHRGPDDEGIYVNGPAGLGMRRLSIVDLASGKQPIFNETGDVAVVFNGEIYNYQALRSDLVSKGHVFRTHTDTEVIVHLYEDLGTECLAQLDGMFALAIWDMRHRKLLLARDRLGEKPLFYARWAKGLVFGSEMKAILAADVPIARDIDHDALSLYLTFMTVPSPFSILTAVRKLPPAHYLLCDHTGTVELRQYWDLTNWEVEEGRSDDSYLEELGERLDQAVRERLIGDVPIGAFLSGGLDSSVVVAHMARASTQTVHTFGVSFQGPRKYDEQQYARQVATHCGTEHHQLMVKPDIVGDIERLVWHWDEPFAVSSAIPVYYMSRFARELVKVVLTGDGGDEVFAGYSRYYLERPLRLASRLPLRWLLGRPGRAELRNLPDFLRRVGKFASAAALGPVAGYVYLLSRFSAAEKEMLLSGGSPARAADHQGLEVALLQGYYERFSGHDVLARRLYGDLKTSLPDEMLTKVDRMTMAVGLEARPPLLDYQLVEFAARLPSRLKMHGRAGKYLLKQHGLQLLPPGIVMRPKHGFNVPLDEWLRAELHDYAWDILTAPQCIVGEYFSKSYVGKILDWHHRGVGDWGHHIWSLLMFELWWRVVAKGAGLRLPCAGDAPVGGAHITERRQAL